MPCGLAAPSSQALVGRRRCHLPFLHSGFNPWLEPSRQTTAFLTRPKVKTAHFLNAERVEQRKKVAEQSSQPASQRPREALGWKQSSNSKRCLRQGSVPALAAAVPCGYAAACTAGLGSGRLQP